MGTRTDSNKRLRGVWRRRYFRLFVLGALLVALFLAVFGPFAVSGEFPKSVVAYAIFPLLAFAVIAGLVWLIRLARGRSQKEHALSAERRLNR